MNFFNSIANIFRPGRLSVAEEINRRVATNAPLVLGAASSPKPRLLSTAELLKCYGVPGDPDNLTTIELPYPFRLDWNLEQRVQKAIVHKKVAQHIINVLNDLLTHYGQEELTRLGIDQYGGCFNHRPQRGLESKYAAAVKAKNTALASTYLSRHAWAIAFDFDPDRNQLKWKAPRAQFSKPEYKPMVDIFYRHGFIGYGRERNNDYMHFEIGILIGDDFKVAPVPGPSPAVNSKRVMTRTGTGKVNVRSGPGINYAVTGQLPHGTMVEVQRQDGAWIFIKSATLSGWMAAEYLK